MRDGRHPDDEAPAEPPVRVSIIIPTYNRAARLRTCLESVCSSVRPDQEIIVVDDGSKDDTRTVVATFGPAVRYIYQQNAGPSAARNTGAREARGRYIAFFDSDDRLVPAQRERVLDFLDSHPEVGVAFTDALVEESNGQSSRAFRREGLETFWALPHRLTPDGFRVFERDPFMRAMILDKCYLVPSISVIRRSALEQVGPFDEALIGYEEWDVFVRLAAAVAFAYLDEPAAVIEKHESNLSGDLEKMVVSGVRVLDKLLGGAVPMSDDLRRATVQKLNAMSFDAARHAFVRGDGPTARERFAAYMKRWGTTLPALAYWSGSWLPSRQVQWLRDVKARLASSR